MKTRFALSTLILLNILFCLSCLTPDDDVVKPGTTPAVYKFQWIEIADSSVTALNLNFWNGGKFYNNSSPADSNFGYWPQAHALDVLVDAYLRTEKTSYVTYMDDWFVGVKIKNGNTFINHYYDDMEWNALAMNRAYRATKDQKWQTESIALWNDIKGGWK